MLTSILPYQSLTLNNSITDFISKITGNKECHTVIQETYILYTLAHTHARARTHTHTSTHRYTHNAHTHMHTHTYSPWLNTQIYHVYPTSCNNNIRSTYTQIQIYANIYM